MSTVQRMREGSGRAALRGGFACALLALSRSAGGAQTIEAYADHRSYAPGATISFHVSTDSPTYSIEIIREALSRQTVDSFGPFTGTFYATPADGWLGANWPVGSTCVVSAAWASGSYLARLVTQDGSDTYRPFVVRAAAPGSTSRIAYMLAYNTRNAYDYWGGKSLYLGQVPPDFQPAERVSFLRPFAVEDGAGKASYLARYCHGTLEQMGYPLEYITEEDVADIPGLLDAYDIIILAAHHEYVSRPWYDALQAFHDRGGHLLFLSSNDIWWQVRFEDNGNTMVCYKQSAIPNDPLYGVNDDLVTTKWGEELINRPGDALQGMSYVRNSGGFEGEDFTVRMASHWAFAGTGLVDGQAVGSGLAFAESDYMGIASPPAIDVLMTARRARPLPNTSPPVPFVDAAVTYYADAPEYGFPNGNGGQVFSGGAQSWDSAMLAGEPDYLVLRRIVQNVLDHMLASPPLTVPGDFDGDRAVTPTDIGPFVRVALGLDATPRGFHIADLNGDGRVDGLDAQRLAELLTAP